MRERERERERERKRKRERKGKRERQRERNRDTGLISLTNFMDQISIFRFENTLVCIWISVTINFPHANPPLLNYLKRVDNDFIMFLKPMKFCVPGVKAAVIPSSKMIKL